MKRVSLLVFLLCIGTASNGLAKTPPHPVIDTTRLVDVFYAAVDRNELRFSGMIMSHHMVKPVEITYSYGLQGRQKTVLIISEMTERVLCPYNKGFYVLSVTARLNDSGQIIEVWHDMLPVDMDHVSDNKK